MKARTDIISLGLSEETRATLEVTYIGNTSTAIDDGYVDTIIDIKCLELHVTDTNGNKVYVLDEWLCETIEKTINRSLRSDLSFYKNFVNKLIG
jgi:hypothetical protein